MAKQNFLGLPHDFSRISSMEQTNINWARIPTYYYDVQQTHFPLTAAEFKAKFSGTIKIFDTSAEIEGHQTNAATGSGVNEPFLAYGVGVVAIGEGLGFTTTGAVVSPPTEGSGHTPCFNGCEIESLDEGPTQVPDLGTLWWGGAVWDFIENFFQAYRLVIVVNNRWMILDESLFDVGMSPTPPEFVGASSSQAPVMPFVQKTNEIMFDKFGKIFLPQNTATGSSCVPAPTAGVTYGHPRIIGLANRLFCFNQAIPMLPGMRFDMQFVTVENGGYFQEAMERSSVLDLTKNTPWSHLNSGPSACPTPGVLNIPGGKVSIGLVLKGMALHPRSVVEYVNSDAISNTTLKMMENNGFLFGLAQQLAATGALKGNLAGLVDPKNRLSGE